jgi:hypothetical protein
MLPTIVSQVSGDRRMNVQEIRNPQSIKEITSTTLLLAVVLPQVEELEDVGMPRLEVDGERSRPFVTALVNIAGGGVVCTEHRHDAVRVSIGASNV